MKRIRLWLSFRLLCIVWVILPKEHTAWKQIFEAAVLIKESQQAADGGNSHV